MLGTNSSNRILIVNGELGIGKSYSAQMVVEEARRRDDLNISILRAKPDSASIWKIDHVASEIVRGLSTPCCLPSLHPVRGDRCAGLLADWTADQIEISGDDLWILLDGFDHPDILPETRMYVDELLTMAGNDPRLDRARFLLFDFNPSRLDALNRNYDVLVLHRPDKDEIIAHFKARYPKAPKSNWEIAADVTMENVPIEGPSCMEMIKLNVRKAYNVFER
jgi:hypothetical protein